MPGISINPGVIQMGFNEIRIGDKLSLFQLAESIIFHLQDFYVRDCVINSMIMLEVENIHEWLSDIKSKELTTSFEKVKLSEIHHEELGNVFYLHDPSVNLWHFL